MSNGQINLQIMITGEHHEHDNDAKDSICDLLWRDKYKVWSRPSEITLLDPGNTILGVKEQREIPNYSSKEIALIWFVCQQ